MKYIIILILFSIKLQFGYCQLIQSGPMLGYCEMKEQLIWLQAKEKSNVKIRYWEKGTNNKMYSEESLAIKKNAFAVKCILDQIEPDKEYYYEILINGKVQKTDLKLSFKSKLQWEQQKDAPDFTFAFGSCAYYNDPKFDKNPNPFGGGNEIYTSISAKKPDFMLWGGDNIYLRDPDFDSRTGILYRYTENRSIPELKPLLAQCPNYAIWDDHDFGPNDGDRSYTNKHHTLEAFSLFWGNNGYGVNGNPGITSSFKWSDCQFFLLDNRYNRSPIHRTQTTECTILGKDQKDWLIDALVFSKAKFKFIVVGSQFLNPVKTKENFSICNSEQNYIIDAITKEKISGVVFLTGDRHATEITKLQRDNTYPLYDITVSPLTSRPHNAFAENNFLRVADTYVSVKNFAIFNISGEKNNRKITITTFTANGEKIWSKEILANELK